MDIEWMNQITERGDEELWRQKSCSNEIKQKEHKE